VCHDDLLDQCQFHAPDSGVLASPAKEVPLLPSIIFAERKGLVELEKRLNGILK
jgi:hypothetical protein